MASNVTREARSRKIMERGADRLALITGRIQTLPSDKTNTDSSSHPLDSNSNVINQDPPSNFSDQISVAPSDEEGFVGSALQSHSPSNDDANIERSIRQAPVKESNEQEAASGGSASDRSNDFRSLLVYAVDQQSAGHTLATERSEPQARRSKFPTSKQIASAFAAMEKPRLLVSLTIALLVILSYFELPLLSNNLMKQILSFRPLYLVILTNLTLVLMQLIFTNRRGEESPSPPPTIPSTGGNDLMEQAGNALEMALLVQNILNAVFMDCCVYAAIVVCGFSSLY